MKNQTQQTQQVTRNIESRDQPQYCTIELKILIFQTNDLSEEIENPCEVFRNKLPRWSLSPIRRNVNDTRPTISFFSFYCFLFFREGGGGWR